jgi:hypothetical protein
MESVSIEATVATLPGNSLVPEGTVLVRKLKDLPTMRRLQVAA